MQMEHAQSLPYASSLCGACYEVCPVKINIPEVLIELRAQVIESGAQTGWAVLRSHVPGDAHREFDFFARVAVPRGAVGGADRAAQFFTRKDGWIHTLPSVGGKWTQTRDLRGLPKQTFHEMVGGSDEQDRERGNEAHDDAVPRPKQVLERIRAATAGSAARNGTERLRSVRRGIGDCRATIFGGAS